MNITDVGHLTSDADAGEDKMMKALKRENLPINKDSMLKIAEKYTEHFKKDLNNLNIIFPDIFCKATEHIPQMIDMIKKIQDNGYTYESESAVYFDISKFKNYGKLAQLKMENLEAGARVEIDKEKINPNDFVLWFKATGKHKNDVMQWDSIFGRGFPGWHIECSAMSTYYLGEQFDIHTGGMDLIPVHHTNEIAQTEAATKKHPWVKYWMHGEFLVLNKEKLSKSTGGSFFTLDSLTNKYDPLSYRYLCLTAHYRKPLNFSLEALDSSQISFNKLRSKVQELINSKKEGLSPEAYIEEFQASINDDLNMPQALAVLWNLIKDETIDDQQKYDAIVNFDRIFGLKLNEIKSLEIPEEILILVEEREKMRTVKNWQESDRIRQLISEKGYTVLDSGNGPVITKSI